MSCIIRGCNSQFGSRFRNQFSVHVENIIFGVETKFCSTKRCIGIFVRLVDADSQLPLIFLGLFPSVSFRSALVITRLIVHGNDSANCLTVDDSKGNAFCPLITGRGRGLC